jgi:alkyldihydroxyacetonephosphate synthase
MRGYFLTYVIAYLRDFAANYNFMAESFATSVPWNNVVHLFTNVKEKIYESCRSKGIDSKIFVSFRVTQVYETVS